VTRSLRCDVRNPLLRLPAADRIATLPPDARAALAELLADIAIDARARAESCWHKRKAPMAAYWKAVAVYASHARRLTKTTAPSAPSATAVQDQPTKKDSQ